MEITRQVILDLLPMYLADEVSPETRAIVEQYLENDPQLAKIAKESKTMRLSENTPAALTQDSGLEAYRKARQLMMWRTIVISVVLAVFLTIVLAMFFISSPSSEPFDDATETVAMSMAPHGVCTMTIEDRCSEHLADIQWRNI